MHEQGTWLHFLYAYHILPEWLPEAVPVTWLVIIVLSAVAILSTRRLERHPRGLQNVAEMSVSALDSLVRLIFDSPLGSKFTPLIGSFFIFILAMNLFGLIPGFMSPTANINTTVALAITAFVMVQYYAVKEIGVRRYLRHFAGEPLWLAPLMVPIHLIGELARPISLSVRLFGNIFGEDMVIAILMIIVTMTMANVLVPVQFPMMLFAIFTSFIQAMVFSILVSVYIAVAVTEEHAEGHGGHGD